jgi:hypothetical protein
MQAKGGSVQLACGSTVVVGLEGDHEILLYGLVWFVAVCTQSMTWCANGELCNYSLGQRCWGRS